jgi:hypothetical protein
MESVQARIKVETKKEMKERRKEEGRKPRRVPVCSSGRSALPHWPNVLSLGKRDGPALGGGAAAGGGGAHAALAAAASSVFGANGAVQVGRVEWRGGSFALRAAPLFCAAVWGMNETAWPSGWCVVWTSQGIEFSVSR